MTMYSNENKGYKCNVEYALIDNILCNSKRADFCSLLRKLNVQVTISFTLDQLFLVRGVARMVRV